MVIALAAAMDDALPSSHTLKVQTLFADRPLALCGSVAVVLSVLAFYYYYFFSGSNLVIGCPFTICRTPPLASSAREGRVRDTTICS